jgi:hypothetical protein
MGDIFATDEKSAEFLWLWEYLYNEHFKPFEFEGFGKHAFLLNPIEWWQSQEGMKGKPLLIQILL